MTHGTKALSSGARRAGQAWLHLQDGIGWAALAAIGVIGFANSYRHVADLFGYYGVTGGWQYALAVITELLAVGYSIEALRRHRIASAERPPMLLPYVGIGIGLSMTLWANLATAVNRGAGGVLTAAFSPVCTLLVMATVETARRRSPRKPARPATTGPVPARRAEPVPAPVAIPEPHPASAPPAEAPATHLTGRFAAAADALRIHGETGEWPTVPALREVGHSEGSARRGLDLAKDQAAGGTPGTGLRVVGE